MKFIAQLRQLWLERSPREQRVLGVAGGFIVLAMLYGFLWDPGLAARSRLAAALLPWTTKAAASLPGL